MSTHDKTKAYSTVYLQITTILAAIKHLTIKIFKTALSVLGKILCDRKKTYFIHHLFTYIYMLSVSMVIIVKIHVEIHIK